MLFKSLPTCDPQLQVRENDSYVINLRPDICKSWCSNTDLIHNNYDFTC